MSFGPGGMPRSRQQQQLDDMLTGAPQAPQPPYAQQPYDRPSSRNGGRTSTMSSFNRRASNSSNQSKGFFGWGRRSKGGDANFDEDDGVDEDFDILGGGGGGGGPPPPGGMGVGMGGYQQSIPRAPSSLGGASTSNSNDGVTMNDISVLRDRDRYPTFGNQSPNTESTGRTMSITSMTGGFDTTPIIPTFRGNEGLANNNYRKNLTNSRKQALRTSDGVAIPPQQPPPPGYRRPPPRGPPGPPGMYGRPPPHPGATSPTDSRLRSMTGPPPDMDMMNHGRTFSLSSGNGSMVDARSPPLDRQSYGRMMNRPGSRSVSNIPEHPRPPMVDSSTMTEDDGQTSLANGNGNVQTKDYSKMVDRGHEARQLPEEVLVTTAPVNGHVNNNDSDMVGLNKSLLDEIRLVTNELADAIRRELGVESLDEAAIVEDEISDPKIRAQQVVQLQQQLDLERRKRLLAESHLKGDKQALQVLNAGYDNLDMERQLTERDRLLKNEQMENNLLRENIASLTEQFESLQQETNQLKNGIVPELKSHVKDLEVLTAAGNPIELLKQIEELKVENKKMEGMVEEQTTRGPLGEKIKTIESQRDALREALRSLRERKDHEIRQSAERVRQLESKLEREKVVNHQMQRKIVQTSLRSASSPVGNGFQHTHRQPSQSNLQVSEPTSSYSSSASSPTEPSPAAVLPISKRRGLGHVPGIVPPQGLPAADSERSTSSSPVSFEISQEPAWLDYVDPSKIPQSHSHRQLSNNNNNSQLIARSSSSSLNLANGRTEALPLSLSG